MDEFVAPVGSISSAAYTFADVPIAPELVRAHTATVGLDDDDTSRLLESYTLAAVAWAERQTRRAIVQRLHTWTIPQFPMAGRPVRLPLGRTLRVASITYTGPAGDQVLRGPTSAPPGTDYAEILSSDIGGLVRHADGAWPDDQDLPVRVAFEAGYTADTLPADLAHALLFYVADAYELRSEANIERSRSGEVRRNLIAGYVIPAGSL